MLRDIFSLSESETSRPNFARFTWSLIGLLLVNTLIAKFAPHWGGVALELSNVLVVAIFIQSWRAHRGLTVPAVALLILFGLGVIWQVFDTGSQPVAILLTVMLGFYLLGLVVAMRRVLGATTVTGDTIFGALAVYLLLALVWAVLYHLSSLLDANAISHLKSDIWFGRFNEFVYFSFVTLTTLGYGDILPVGPIARFLVYTEATVGQFYIAVLVASLVSKRGKV